MLNKQENGIILFKIKNCEFIICSKLKRDSMVNLDKMMEQDQLLQQKDAEVC